MCAQRYILLLTIFISSVEQKRDIYSFMCVMIYFISLFPLHLVTFCFYQHTNYSNSAKWKHFCLPYFYFSPQFLAAFIQVFIHKLKMCSKTGGWKQT